MDRRSFLAGALPAAFALRVARWPVTPGTVVDGRRPLGFEAVPASDRDELRVPAGHRADVVISYGDAVCREAGGGQRATFGYNNDYTAFVPLDARAGGRSSERGLLFVNHEYASPLLQHGTVETARKTREQVRLEMLSVGCSVLEVERRAGRWHVLEGSPLARRLSALGPDIDVSGPAAGSAAMHERRRARGTLANCSGGVTPWHTVTTCEENFQYSYGWGAPPFEGPDGWHRFFPGFSTDYGWVVEVDPFGELPTRKRTALGRFAHENCAFATTADGRLVVYTGDDRPDRCVYKFVSSWQLTGERARDHEHALDEGVLHAADFEACVWRRLCFDDDPALWRGRGFAGQADIVVRAREAAAAAGATPMDRPEGIAVHPETGEVYIAFTKNDAHGEVFGRIAWLREEGGEHGATSFAHGVLAAGGADERAFACPDNLMLDHLGGLWMANDVSGVDLLRGAHRHRGNNALFFVETRGEHRGRSHRFAVGPRGAEFTGPSTTPDGTTLFVSVQHPGETSPSREQLDSHWPRGGDALPLPSVVAITREDGAAITG